MGFSCPGQSPYIILDEVQSSDDILRRLRSAIDEDRKRQGRFLLLGSVSPTLMTLTAESLVGRLSVCELSAFNMLEIGKDKQDRLWRIGGFPDGGILSPRAFPGWQENYLKLLSQRDFPSWGLTANPQMTQRLFKMLAYQNGQLWNASRIGQALGISYHTASHYTDFLENAFLIRRLPAYSGNLKKRLTKSPKLYWRDSGLLHFLMGMERNSKLMDYPWVGASWEGWVLEQILSALQMNGIRYQAWHFRSQTGEEINLLLETGSRLFAIEVKFSSVPAQEDFSRLKKLAALVKADQCFLVCRTTESTNGISGGVVNLSTLISCLRADRPTAGKKVRQNCILRLMGLLYSIRSCSLPKVVMGRPPGTEEEQIRPWISAPSIPTENQDRKNRRGRGLPYRLSVIPHKTSYYTPR